MHRRSTPVHYSEWLYENTPMDHLTTDLHQDILTEDIWQDDAHPAEPQHDSTGFVETELYL